LVISEYDIYRFRVKPMFAENKEGELVMQGLGNKGFVYPKYSCKIVE